MYIAACLDAVSLTERTNLTGLKLTVSTSEIRSLIHWVTLGALHTNANNDANSIVGYVDAEVCICVACSDSLTGVVADETRT